MSLPLRADKTIEYRIKKARREREAEKKFCALIASAKQKRQRQINTALERARTAIPTAPQVSKRELRYRKNHTIAAGELIKVEKANQTLLKMQANEELTKEIHSGASEGTTAEVITPSKITKSQAAAEEKFFARLEKLKTRREEKIKKMVEKQKKKMMKAAEKEAKEAAEEAKKATKSVVTAVPTESTQGIPEIVSEVPPAKKRIRKPRVKSAAAFGSSTGKTEAPVDITAEKETPSYSVETVEGNDATSSVEQHIEPIDEVQVKGAAFVEPEEAIGVRKTRSTPSQNPPEVIEARKRYIRELEKSKEAKEEGNRLAASAVVNEASNASHSWSMHSRNPSGLFRL